MMEGVDHALLFDARARVLADLHARNHATPEAVSVLEDGLVAQDVQDALLETVGRWPVCLSCGDAPMHALYIQPDLGGPDPMWVCEESGRAIAELGRLGRRP